MAEAHSSRHVRERLGHHDDAPAARGHIGQRAEPEQRRTGVDSSLGHGQHPRQRRYTGRHAGDISSRRAVLHPCDVAVFRSFKSRIQAKASATLARSVIDSSFEGFGHEHCMAAPVFGRMDGSRSHGLLRREQGLEHGMASIARTKHSTRPLKRPTSCTPLACSRDRSSQSPLQQTLWTGPWQRRQTTKTTRLCQTHRMSWS